MSYIDGSCAVDCINCSLVTPVSRLMQSDGYQCCFFICETRHKLVSTFNKSLRLCRIKIALNWDNCWVSKPTTVMSGQCSHVFKCPKLLRTCTWGLNSYDPLIVGHNVIFKCAGH